MPNKIKLKKPNDARMKLVKLAARDKKKILIELLELDLGEASDKAHGEKLLAALEEYLAICLHRRDSMENSLSPAHVVAPIKSINEAAGALKKLIDPNLMHVQVITELSLLGVLGGDWTGILWERLSKLQFAAELAIARLDGENSIGVHNANKASWQSTTIQMLKQFYKNNSTDPDDGGNEQEFVKLCLPYCGSVNKTYQRR